MELASLSSQTSNEARRDGEIGDGKSSFPWILAGASSLTVIALVLGLVFDRVGSAELFFSGLALLLFQDLRKNKKSGYFQRHSSSLSLTMFLFVLGFAVLGLGGGLELIGQGPLLSLQQYSTIEIVGGALLLVGIGPYLMWAFRGK